MRIGVIGGGNIGGTLGRLWAAANHTVTFTSRHPEKLEPLAAEAGVNAHVGELRKTLEWNDILLLAAPYRALEEAFAPMADRFGGKFVIDAMNPFPDRDGAIAEKALAKGSAVLQTAELLPYARLVRAFSNVYFKVLQEEAHREGQRVAIPFAGNDPEAKEVAAALISDAGFDPYDIGSLHDSRPIDPDGALFKTSYTVKELEKALAAARRR